jgi:hypothetical protein
MSHGIFAMNAVLFSVCRVGKVSTVPVLHCFWISTERSAQIFVAESEQFSHRSRSRRRAGRHARQGQGTLITIVQLVSACGQSGLYRMWMREWQGNSSLSPLSCVASPHWDVCVVAFARIEHVRRIMQARWDHSRLDVIMFL